MAPAKESKPRRRRVIVPAAERDDLVADILERVSQAQDERADWIQKRLARYAKLRGWLEPRTWPWTDASNQHVPIMLANKLRMDAGLYNAVLGMRPVMRGTPTRIEHREMAERIDHLLDHQMFVDNEGDRQIEKYIDQFTGDGTVFSFQPWIKERGAIHDVRAIPRPELPDLVINTETLDHLVTDQIGAQGFTTLTRDDDAGYRWTGMYTDADGVEREADIRVYDHHDPNKIEVVFEWDAPLFEGPTMVTMDLEDVVAPMRSENLQPVSGKNPTGAPWVATIHKVDMDSVRRRQHDGIYDLLTVDDLETFMGVTTERTQRDTEHSEDALKEQKDTTTGLQASPSDKERDWLTVIQWYGGYDANGDGLNEQVILTIVKEHPTLARARYLTEQYPGLPPRRPFGEARFIPIPGQLYGMGLPELTEGLHDMLHVLVNQSIDNGSLANLPFGAYRASSGFKPETQRLEPGVLLALDNPQTDLAFPQMPNRDQSWGFNMIGLAMQFLEKLVQVGPMQFGQVPEGKASALRTVGTTMAILQQGAAMPEQILRRLFLGLRDVYSQFHMLNTRFLPPKKRFLVTGRPLDSEEAYGVIDDRTDIAIPVSFDFQATLLNTNKGLVAQSLLAVGQALATPLMMQMGLFGTEQAYNWARDIIQANQLDPARYLKRPAGMPEMPRITAEEAILSITEGRLPMSVAPLEPLQEHYQKLMDFLNSDDFGLLVGGKELLFREYISMVTQQMQQELQQQQQMEAAQQFNTMLRQQAGGGGQVQAGQPPPPQPERGTAEELAGAVSAPHP